MTIFISEIFDDFKRKLITPYPTNAELGTNWMDGSGGVTQCPIPPGQSFTYNFTVPNQWGTYWWHAHAASQYVDGIVGTLRIQLFVVW